MGVDERIKRLFPVGMRDAVDLTIHLKCGFELFNTRPYHNYETWSNGWYAEQGGKVIAQGESLDDLANDLEAWASGDFWYRSEKHPGRQTYNDWREAHGFNAIAIKPRPAGTKP